MRKRRKRILGIGCAIIMMLATIMPVFANDGEAWIVDGSKLVNEAESVSDTMLDYRIEFDDESIIEPRSATYLYGGHAKISNAGGGKVNIYAYTKGKVVCDKVELDIYLQYYDNGSWVHVNNWNYSTKNKPFLSASRTLSVTKGRYYRIKCYHAVTKNGVKEKSTTMTDGIPIK